VGYRVAVPGEALKVRLLEASQQLGFRIAGEMQYIAVLEPCSQQAPSKEHGPPRAEMASPGDSRDVPQVHGLRALPSLHPSGPGFALPKRRDQMAMVPWGS